MTTRIEVRSSVLSCTRCSLATSSSGPVPFRGPDHPKLAIVAEAPGKVEDKEGKPLVGPSGVKVSEWLARAKIDEKDVAFLNAVSCFPNRTPSPEEVVLCRPNLINQLSYLSPGLLLIMGGVALSSFWSGLRMGDARGLWWKATIPAPTPLTASSTSTTSGPITTPMSVWAIATYHPAAVLRNPSLDGFAIRDVLQAKLALSLNEKWSPHPSPRCLQCGDWMTVLRTHSGEDVTEKVGDWGGLAWCAKHDGLRMGTAGQGRKTATTSTTGRKGGQRGSAPSPRRGRSASTKLSAGSSDKNQTGFNIEKYRVR